MWKQGFVLTSPELVAKTTIPAELQGSYEWKCNLQQVYCIAELNLPVSSPIANTMMLRWHQRQSKNKAMAAQQHLLAPPKPLRLCLCICWQHGGGASIALRHHLLRQHHVVHHEALLHCHHLHLHR